LGSHIGQASLITFLVNIFIIASNGVSSFTLPQQDKRSKHRTFHCTAC
jgi:hypothetical protein